MEIYYRRAVSRDKEKILDLHKKNLYQNIKENNLENGFVRTALSDASLSLIIEEGIAVIAIHDTMLVGYYLMYDINDYQESIGYLKSASYKYSYKGKTVSSYSILIGNQACVAKEYRSTGIGRLLFLEICKIAKINYQLLFGSITKTNTVGYNYNTSFNNSKIIGEDEERWYIIFDLELEI